MARPHHIVIVGGGAGGLELATRAGDTLARSGRAGVTLVDRNETHLCKPLLHESAAEADRFHRRLINACIQANYRSGDTPARLRIVIVGGGATGVELAAELHNTTRVLAAYGLENIDPERFLQITLLDAGPRILPMLPERIAKAATGALEDIGVRVACSEQVVEVTAS